jgi:hypothetical protein
MSAGDHSIFIWYNSNMDTTIQAPTIEVSLTPHAMATVSYDLLFLVKEPPRESTPASKYLLYCMSIELGLKSLILSKDNSKNSKETLKRIRHDIKEAYSQFEEKYAGVLSEEEKTALERINPYFERKGLEYFTADTIKAHLQGLSPFPELAILERAATKINNVVKKEILNI